MLAWAVVWKEKRRKETKQKHWPTKKRKQERKRTKHPAHSSQSVKEGESMPSAFLCWSGHRQAVIEFALLKPVFSFLQPFCSSNSVMSPVSPWARSAGPKGVSDLPSSLAAVSCRVRAVWHLQVEPFPAPLLGWVSGSPNPHWALADASSPCSPSRYEAITEPEAVWCSQHLTVDKLTKYIALGLGWETALSAPASVKIPLVLRGNS